MLKRNRKSIAVFLSVIILTDTLLPITAVALTGGPSQPEVQSFEPVGTSEMVDLFTGDFNYNIPLLDVGGYPINISYHSGISTDQEASWVGLGWNINPGVINRNMRGLPDDFKGDPIVKEFNVKPNETYGGSLGAGIQLFGKEIKSSGNSNEIDSFYSMRLSMNFGVNYNNYKGVGYEFSLSPSFSGGNKGMGEMTAGLGLSANSQSGIDISPNISYANTISKTKATASISSGFNSREGVKELNFGISAEQRKMFKASSSRNNENSDKKKEKFLSIKGSVNLGSSVSFSGRTYTPSVSMPFISSGVAGSFTIGYELLGMHPNYNIKGYYSKQSLAVNTITNPSYGFFYDRYRGEDGIADINREKEGAYSVEQSYLPIPQHTYDVYSVSGQGIGGVFKPTKSNISVLSDQESGTSGKNFSISGEVGIGNINHFGYDANSFWTKTENGSWSGERNRFKNHVSNKRTNNDPLFEEVYFKGVGEKTVADLDFFNSMLFNKPARIVVNNKFSIVSAEDSLEYFDFNGNNMKATRIDTSSVYRKKRDIRNQSISYLTNEEVSKIGFLQQRFTYGINSPLYSNNPTLYSTNSAVKKSHHIGEVVALGADGMRYVYGIAAYNNLQIETSFALDPSKIGQSNLPKALYRYSGNDASVQNNNGDDNFFESIKTPGYAHSYLLTEVLSPDYVDLTGNGVSDDDLGSAIKISYSRVNSSYKWRVPVEENMANYNEGSKTDARDDKGNVIYGEKELYYVHSIENKGQIAIFSISPREDGLGVNGIAGGASSQQRMYKLDKIALYSKNDYFKNGVQAIPIKTVFFEYEYSLCNGIPNVSNNLVNNIGKLTLKKIYFTYGKSNKGKLTPYEFNYSSFNPSYHLKAYDRWGNYAPPKINDLFSFEFPYTVQNKDLADQYAQAWTLSQIYLPTGGVINIDYESDDYAYVQNQRAMEMYKIAGTSFNPGDLDTTGTLYKKVGGNFLLANYLYFVPSQNQPSSLNEAQDYIDGVNDLFFNALVDVDNKGGNEFIRGWAEIDHSFPVGSININDKIYYYLRIKSTPIGDNDKKTDGNNSAHAISKNSWNYARVNLPKLVFPASYAPASNDAKKNMTALATMADDIKKMVLGFNKELRSKGFASKIKVGKSWIRLNNLKKKKLGGGIRVKRIRLNDNWANMATQNNWGVINAEYGQEYGYTTIENGKEISSGVASYEPIAGGEENPLKQPRAITIQHKMAPDTKYFQEDPACESYFPAATVGYSKITVTSLASSENYASNSGKEVSEFYTAKDFPTFVRVTPKEHDRDKPIIPSILYKYSKESVVFSQGYVVELNDMHGKPKGNHSYKQGEDKPFSGVNYLYQRNKEDPRRLDNEVLTINPNGEISMKQVGVEMDVVVDMREEKSELFNSGINFNQETFSIVLPAVISIPIPLPSITQDKTQFNSAVLVKVINRNGILQKIEVQQEGSMVSTENVLFDGQTGEVLMTKIQNEFNDHSYNLTFPAHWVYEGMGQAYRNIGMSIDGVELLSNQIILPNGLNANDLFIPGDELMVVSKTINGDTIFVKKGWIYSGDGNLNVIDKQGASICNSSANSTNRYFLKVIRSGRKNLASTSIASFLTRNIPLNQNQTALQLDVSKDILNASAFEFKDKWRTEPYLLKQFGQCDPRKQSHLDFISLIDSFLRFNSGIQNISEKRLDNCVGIETNSLTNKFLTTELYHQIFQNELDCAWNMYSLDYGSLSNTNQWKVKIQAVSALSNHLPSNNSCTATIKFSQNLSVFNLRSVQSNFAVCTDSSITINFLTSNGSVITAKATFSCLPINPNNDFCYDNNSYSMVNPYEVGVLGNWRPSKNYVYHGERKYSSNFDPRLKSDGGFKSFEPFFVKAYPHSPWIKNTSNGANKWVWSNEITNVSPQGEELENMNALGIYSSVLFGYNNYLPIAVASNSKRTQMGFDGFEDYYERNATCLRRHFNFEDQLGSNVRLSAIEAHSGLYALEVDPGSKAKMIRDYESPNNNLPNQAINYQSTSDDQLIRFSPSAGKYMISGWVKENQPNSFADTTYSNANIEVKIRLANGSFQMITLLPSGKIIDGWQRIESQVIIPNGVTEISIALAANGVKTWFDDVRAYPADGNMESYVYHNITHRLMAKLDANNFAIFYEYDKEGNLIRIKRETEMGIVTLKEVRQNSIKYKRKADGTY